ncbi:MAG: hypothetical protein ACD_30C00112G0051 [uncultured bacterium]|uniref:Acyl carrier protein n=3 Tax=Candidatus Daviesiibacteriota TaxID=1752718 RepID=A0A0G0HEI3_9BACT|nr:MAG: hypothetical protein ACD_30C00112G0051 [uncultured bacterium]KKQ10529.1 MAG: Acyl carrier protein [Candidatus Daviesbacteria bacterium GW2011_GWB1_36_5]OGE17210.1 MAG: hypothetical protein A2858_00705 [Candidatus Daviesbacteria bacterium RIFCSPHIGHO2_01_FULL_36_37]OGE35991.1 MAG: hypothetical protein A3E66_01700 [Candidatus Daviesbacteria bacterium RIFCSPHIGHO2_12_FULL_37_16]
MQQQIIAEIAKHLAVTPADIDPNATMSEDLGLGPVEIADLLSYLSSKFNVTFDQSEVENLETVHDLIVAIEDLSLDE